MILLTTAALPQLMEHRHPNLGRLIQPRHYPKIRETAAAGFPWAADNDAFQGWNPEREERFVRMLNTITGLPGCKFVAAPDVVGDAERTLELYERWHDPIHLERRLRIALVLQDGIDEVPWDYLDAVFVGGTTDFKMSDLAADIVREAKQRGKWAHMGRVNSLRRIRYAASIGCDSFDGTKFSRWRDTWLPEGLAHAASGRQLAFQPEHVGAEAPRSEQVGSVLLKARERRVA